MSETAPNGPIVQSISLALRALYAVVILLAVAWIGSNVRRVPPESTAVVFRFGEIVRVRGAGLLVCLPAPFETVTILPGPAQQMTHPITPQSRSPGLDDLFTQASGVSLQGGAGSYLTGDGNVVLLDASLTYRIVDPAAYVLTRDHVNRALDRIFRSAAIAVAGHQALDDFLVAQPGRNGGDVAAIRQQVRDDLLAAVNTRLDRLAAEGAPLGVAVQRIDLTAALPPQAKLAYDALLVAEQVADQGIAAAHTQALRTGQQADRDVRQILDGAHAAAAERVSTATTSVSPVLALESGAAAPARAGLLLDAYRSRLAGIMTSAGQVVAVDPSGGNRLILPAAK